MSIKKIFLFSILCLMALNIAAQDYDENDTTITAWQDSSNDEAAREDIDRRTGNLRPHRQQGALCL